MLNSLQNAPVSLRGTMATIRRREIAIYNTHYYTAARNRTEIVVLHISALIRIGGIIYRVVRLGGCKPEEEISSPKNLGLIRGASKYIK